MAEAENLEIVVRTFTPESQLSDEESEEPTITSRDVMSLVRHHMQRQDQIIEEHDNNYKDLATHFKTVAKELETERKEKRALEERYNSKKGEIHSHQQLNVKLRKTLKSKGQEISSLQNQVETLGTKLAEKTSEVDEWKRHYNDFKNHVENEQTHNQNLEKKLEGEYEKNRVLLEKWGATNSLLSREREKSELLEHQVDGMQAEIVDLKAKLERADMQHDMVEDEVQKILVEKILRSRLSTVKNVRDVKNIRVNRELEEEIQKAKNIVDGLRVKYVRFLKTKQSDIITDAPVTKRSRSCDDMSFDTISTTSANAAGDAENNNFDFDD